MYLFSYLCTLYIVPLYIVHRPLSGVPDKNANAATFPLYIVHRPFVHLSGFYRGFIEVISYPTTPYIYFVYIP